MLLLMSRINFHLHTNSINNIMASSPIAVCMPVHIKSNDDIEALDEALTSLEHQTLLPDVYVSLSCNSSLWLNKIYTLKDRFQWVNFLVATQQMFQMEHLEKLVPWVIKYKLVMFLDGDDFYHPHRCQIFNDAYSAALEQKSTMEIAGVREPRVGKQGEPYFEYWSFGIKPSLLAEFFDRCHDKKFLLKDQYGDMYFLYFLTRKAHCVFGELKLNTPLYFYNTENPQSISNTIRSEKTPPHQAVAHNIRLLLIGKDYKGLHTFLKKINLPSTSIKHYVPSVLDIQQLTSKLYDL